MSHETRVTLSDETYAALRAHAGSPHDASRLADRLVRVGLAALLADGSLERQPALPVAPPAPAPEPPKPAEPALSEPMRAVLSKLNGSAVEGTAEELAAQGFGASATGVAHTLHALERHGIISRERAGYRPGSHGAVVSVWRIAKAVKP